MAPSAMTGLGRERPSPWYDADCVFVCVCVCLCVYSRVGASCVARPTCVCAVWAPPARKYIYIYTRVKISSFEVVGNRILSPGL